MERLHDSKVAVFGLGGVGGMCAEALLRSGVGELGLIDADRVEVSNLNRQIIASQENLGRPKTEVMQERLLSINPAAKTKIYNIFFLPENAADFPFGHYDYLVDAIDTVTAKVELVLRAAEAGVPLISSMGTGGKLKPGELKLADIYETKNCPLARVMRRELRKRRIPALKVVYSPEPPQNKSRPPGSFMPVTATAGLMLAAAVVEDLVRSR